MTLTDQIKAAMQRGSSRQEINRRFLAKGFNAHSVRSIASRLFVHGDSYKEIDRARAEAMRRRRGVLPAAEYRAARQAPQPRDEIIRRNYLKLSVAEISRMLGCSRNTVIGRADRLGLTRRHREEARQG